MRGRRRIDCGAGRRDCLTGAADSPASSHGQQDRCHHRARRDLHDDRHDDRCRHDNDDPDNDDLDDLDDCDDQYGAARHDRPRARRTGRHRAERTHSSPSDSHAAEPIVEIGTISIPKIGVEMTMFEGIRLTTLDHGPGHWPGSALPGADGNVVVGGHRVSKHQVFRNVDQLVAGDEIIFSDAGGTHVYQVDRVEIVEPTDIWIIDPTDTPTATLFACHPPGSTSQRIAVFADLVG